MSQTTQTKREIQFHSSSCYQVDLVTPSSLRRLSLEAFCSSFLRKISFDLWIEPYSKVGSCCTCLWKQDLLLWWTKWVDKKERYVEEVRETSWWWDECSQPCADREKGNLYGGEGTNRITRKLFRLKFLVCARSGRLPNKWGVRMNVIMWLGGLIGIRFRRSKVEQASGDDLLIGSWLR